MLRSLAIGISKQTPAKTFYSTTETKVVGNKNESALLQKLSNEFEGVSQIASTVNDEHVKNIKIEEWKNRIYVFKAFNFEDSDCFRMISRYPFLLKIPPTDLENVLRQWNACELGMDNVINLISDKPELLDVEVIDIKKRVPHLRALFKSPKLLATLLANSPNLMTDDWDSTLKKINYLLKVQRVNSGELLQSCALSKSLDLFMLRFDILEKCGGYRKPTKYAHKKNKYEKTGFQNPHLRKIIDFNDELFANQTAGITLEEYQVYEDLSHVSGMDENDEDEDDED